jgi:hypothetical protein
MALMPWADGYTPRTAADFVERHGGLADLIPVDDAPYLVRDRRGMLARRVRAARPARRAPA